MADQKLTSLPEHTATNNNDLLYVVASPGNVSKLIRLSTLKNIFGEKNKDTYLDFGGGNQVTAAQVKNAVTKAHDQNTDLGTNSDNFTLGFGELGDIYLYFGEEGPGIRLNVGVSPSVLEWSNDGVVWQEFGTGSGGEWGTIEGTITAQTDLVNYVATQIAALVDSSPAALDTLNELAAALGDDPNFATTVLNALANKADKSGTDDIYVNGFGGTQIGILTTGDISTEDNSGNTTVYSPDQISVQRGGFETVIVTEDPTANQTITFPDASGEVILDNDPAINIFLFQNFI